MNPPAVKPSRPKVPRRVVAIGGYVISLACLIWVYRGFDWKPELARFATLDWGWVALSIACDLGVYVCQGWRWRLLLKPVSNVSLARSVQSVYIGLFANEILPFRTGELVRCYLMAHWGKIPFSVAASSAVVERLLDGLILVGGFVITASVVDMPRYLVEGSRILGMIVIFFAVLLGLVMFHKHHAHAAVSKSRWANMLWHVVEGLHAMGNSKTFAAAAGASLVYLGAQVLPILALVKAYGMDLTLGQCAVILVILRLGTILPLAPGNIGSFQAAAKAGLILFGISNGEAVGFATLLFFVVTVPLWLAGFLALAATGMKLEDLHRHARAGRSQPKPEATGPRVL